MEVSEQSEELLQDSAQDANVMAELRSQANELLDWLVQLDSKHCEEVAVLRQQLTRLDSDAAADAAVSPSTAAVENDEVSGRGAADSSAGIAAFSDDAMMLVLGVAVGILFVFMLVLARSSFQHKTAKQTISRLLAWAESHGKVPELSKAALWSSRASTGGAGRARFPASGGSGKSGGVLSMLFRGVLFVFQSTIGAILSGLLRGISQGLFWILTLPFILMSLLWLFKLVTSWRAESSALQADFVLTKDASESDALGGKLSKGISGVLNGMVRQILL
mmetsp:Transcript_126381/g.236196  ORF Transcript_126381/g.236196 Transcript_126381/m.236196 type:complete len:277 (+) Transcript_126381:68-898(+)